MTTTPTTTPEMACEFVEEAGTGYQLACREPATYGCDGCGLVICRFDLPRHLLREHVTRLRGR